MIVVGNVERNGPPRRWGIQGTRDGGDEGPMSGEMIAEVHGKTTLRYLYQNIVILIIYCVGYGDRGGRGRGRGNRPRDDRRGMYVVWLHRIQDSTLLLMIAMVARHCARLIHCKLLHLSPSVTVALTQ